MSDKLREGSVESRRRFLKTCGKFAVITPPVVSLMLSSTDKAYAGTRSGVYCPPT